MSLKSVFPVRLRSALGPLLVVTLLGGGALRAEEANQTCPLMTKDEADPEEVVDFKGHSISLCCGKCARAWKASETAAAYYAKVATELGLLPQLKGKEKELGLDQIELMKQRYSAISFDTLVTPESPSVEYQGVKVYFFNDKEVEKWNKDPEAAAKKAIAAGVLPQLEESKEEPAKEEPAKEEAGA